ncbi:MAG: RNA methyltransferase [Lachnospiraceae bacterium]|nr:RNA methyltransferase [Lachnospiraceae bacterium]
MTEIIKVTDLKIPQLEVYNLRSEVQLLHYYEPEEGIFIAESPKVIRRAIDAGYKPVSVLVESAHIENENAEVSEILHDIENAPVYMADFDVLTKLTGYKLTNGMLACMRRKPLPSVADICTGATRIAILEDVVNPTNLGAIFRSAAALNVDAVILTPACADPLYRRAARVSMGTVFSIPFSISEKVYDEVKSIGFKTTAMALTNRSISVSDPAPKSEEKLAIILGNEGNGLKPETIEMCDYTIKIPMREGVDSLNVAAASAVAFFELC